MIFKCKICGGTLDIKENNKITTCEYCGTKQTLPKLENHKITNLYDRANHYRRNNEYDKAEALYEMILNEDDNDAETYWSLILCKYGVTYVKDPKTDEYIPTCNRTQAISIFADENYKQALKYANDEQKQLYKTEAEKINNIQKGILEISNKEEAFDIFICYKETDESGNRTQDSVIAQQLYHELQKEGYKVFFSKITLEDKIGESYEPYIYAALNSAKVMLVIGTKKEYFNATWVKNEWSRYIALIKNGENKTIIPCFKEMDAYDLPEEFAHLQAQDMSKIGFEQDLIYGIKKIASKEPKKKSINKTLVIVIVMVLILVGVILFEITRNIQNKKENLNQSKEITNIKNGTKTETNQIIRKDITAVGGKTFNTKAEDLKAKIMEKIQQTEYKDSIEAKVLCMDEQFLAIGWFNEDEVDVIGIEIYYEGEYVSNVICKPAKYGSGDIASLAIPENLYEEAKKILGSETEEWKELVKSETIKETVSDYYGEEVTDGTFYAGMTKSLYIE